MQDFAYTMSIRLLSAGRAQVKIPGFLSSPEHLLPGAKDPGAATGETDGLREAIGGLQCARDQNGLSTPMHSPSVWRAVHKKD